MSSHLVRDYHSLHMHSRPKFTNRQVACIGLNATIRVWPTSWTPAVGGLFVCESVSADMSPYCSAHDEWLIMKLCTYVGYHDANNVSNFGGDPIQF